MNPLLLFACFVAFPLFAYWLCKAVDKGGRPMTELQLLLYIAETLQPQYVGSTPRLISARHLIRERIEELKLEDLQKQFIKATSEEPSDEWSSPVD